MGSACFGQSLGDAARRAREQKQKNANTAKRIYTSDDLTNPDAKLALASTKSAAAAPKDGSPAYESVGTAGFTADTWRKTIKAQKAWIAHLQEAADELKKPPQFDSKQVATNPEARRQWEERGIQEQLASEIPEQKKKLEQMQADAKKAGMPPWIWDVQ